MFDSIISQGITIENFILCIVVAMILGLGLAFVHSLKNNSSKGFVITVALLPSVVSMIIMLVNGNLGVGVAVAGAFSLVRFRSIPGNAKEINTIFISMAIGLATGMGYLLMALIFVVLVGGFIFLLDRSKLGESKWREKERELKITIPEHLDYTEVFDEVFSIYLEQVELIRVKTSNMGSLFKLQYRIRFKEVGKEKALMDEIRCMNGNLEIMCSKITTISEEL